MFIENGKTARDIIQNFKSQLHVSVPKLPIHCAGQQLQNIVYYNYLLYNRLLSFYGKPSTIFVNLRLKTSGGYPFHFIRAYIVFVFKIIFLFYFSDTKNSKIIYGNYHF